MHNIHANLRCFSLVLGLLLGVSLSSPNCFLHAQETEKTEAQSELEDQREEDDVAFDEESSEDEEDGDEEEGHFGELMWVRRELEHELEVLADKTALTKKRIEKIDQFIAVAKRAGELEEQIADAEEAGNERLVEQLAEEFEKVEAEIGIREEMLELEYELVEVTESLEEAEREEEIDRVEILETLVDGLRTIGELSEEILPLELSGDEAAKEPLEVRKALVFTNQVEKPFRALQVLEQLWEAEEEEDDDRIAELESKFSELRRDIEHFREHGTEATDQAESEKQTQPKPTIQPIVVNDETLSRYAGLDLHKEVAPLLERYCFDCHSNDESSGELNFEKLLAISPIVKSREQWVNVIEQSKNHVMPPEDADQPTQQEREKIVLALHNAVYDFDYSGIDDPGFESARRLTHREYSNTVRDLFGIKIDVVDRFPDDLTATSGFDNSANSLFIQPLLMERYIGIAEHVVDSALPATGSRTPEQQGAFDRLFIAMPPASAKANNVRKAAEAIMRQFLLRAYRRPATKVEVDRFANQITKTVAAGESFTTAVKATVQTVLITPSFLLRTESIRSAEPDSYEVNDWELANRLSYFLWASMPDDELFALAKQKRLREPNMLSSQVQRMIADEKASSLGTVFTAQWLGSQHLGVRTRLDPIDNPWCTETLMTAMRDETSLFFNSLVRENRPITELVDADYTFLNEELAKLYRIRGVEGEHMRRVSLKTKQRGGIFGQGSLLAVTSFPGRTSPVVRGKWILDTVLGTPPPPPPPNVSELSEEIEGKRRLSFREKLELHREKPNCYACHSQMDPLGFSLENFDWFGRYRTRRGRGRIDSTGKLPNGTEFTGLAGLKQVVVEQRKDDLTRQLTQKLLSYALGRQLEYYDEPAIRTILKAASDDDARMQKLIHEIVKSYPFQYKKNRSVSVAANSTQR